VVSPNSKFDRTLDDLNLILHYHDDQKVLSLLHYFANDVDHSLVENFYVGLHHLTDDIVRELTKINSSFSPNIITEYSFFIYDKDYWHEELNIDKSAFFSKLPAHEIFHDFMNSLSKLTLLQKLHFDIRVQDTDYIKSIESALVCLVKLTELNLSLNQGAYDENNEDMLMEMPIHKLPHLEVLNMDFSPKFRFNDLMDFFDKMSQVENLTSFTIGCSEIDFQDEDVINKISIALNKFPKCKKLFVAKDESEGGCQYIYPKIES